MLLHKDNESDILWPFQTEVGYRMKFKHTVGNIADLIIVSSLISGCCMPVCLQANLAQDTSYYLSAWKVNL